MHKLKRKRYNSLVELKKEIQDKGKEKVLDFNGYSLVTNKNKYTMVDSMIYVNGVLHGVD